MNITIVNQAWQVQFEIRWYYGDHYLDTAFLGRPLTLCWN